MWQHDFILGDPGADSGDAGKSKRAEKYGTKKSKEWREEPLGTMSYQTSSKRSPPFWLLIGARKTQVSCRPNGSNVIFGELFSLSNHFVRNFRGPKTMRFIALKKNLITNLLIYIARLTPSKLVSCSRT